MDEDIMIRELDIEEKYFSNTEDEIFPDLDSNILSIPQKNQESRIQMNSDTVLSEQNDSVSS
ncbi:MAG: hypothetical protein ACO3P9_08875, partial [Phycisphaerales bacterium]